MTLIRHLTVLALTIALVACGSEPSLETKPASAPRLDRVAFGSCSVQFLPQVHWAAIQGENPDLFIFGGDNVYGDLIVENGEPRYGEGTPELLAASYAFLANIPEFKTFREAVPILPVWDDHDFGENGAGGTYNNKEDSERQFLEFWRVPEGDERRARPGIYTSSVHGPVGERVQIIVLDTRFFRSDLTIEEVPETGQARNVQDSSPDKTMIGAEQWAWLEQQLKLEADIRLIVSSVQITATAHPYEKWGNFPHERDRLFQLIEETRANGVVFLTGDRHLSGIYARRRDVGYPLFELTSSSLNHTFGESSETDPLLLGEVYPHPNYSTLTFDWENRTLMLEVKDMQGKTVRAAGLEIDELQAG